MEVGKIEGVAFIVGREGELGRFSGAEVTKLSPTVWGLKAIRRWGASGVVDGRFGGSTGPSPGGGSV